MITFAEIGVKASVGRLEVPSEIGKLARDGGLRILRLEPEHGLAVASLPMRHRDPFDRLLIAQARAEGFAIITADARFREYEVDVVDARA